MTARETDPAGGERYRRWRLILGRRAEQALGAARGGDGDVLDGDAAAMDDALAAVYEPTFEDSPGEEGRTRRAGLGARAGRLARWLGDIRQYFDQDVVALLQRDGISRLGLSELLLEPEALAAVVPSVELAATLMALKDMIPDATLESARMVVAAVVAAVQARLAPALDQAVRGAVRRGGHAPRRSLADLDWRRTIQANLANYQPERGILVAERLRFIARQPRCRAWHVIVCLDQSGSMAESVVYGAVMAAVFATLPALETHVLAFDTEVVDLTDRAGDAVDLLFGVQLGGGTDLHRAVSYAHGLVHDPRRTLVLVISDLFEGGNERALVRRVGAMTADGARVVFLLALSDRGAPSYDGRLARLLREAGGACLACTPSTLPDLLQAALRGDDVEAAAAHWASSD